MPTYDYLCNKCNKKMEIAHAMSALAPVECPECGARNSLEKMVSAVRGIIFKGSGFYETDYKRASAKTEKAKTETSGANSGAESTPAPQKKCNPGCGCH